MLLRPVRQLPSFDFLLITPNSNGIPVWKKLAKVPVAFHLDAYAVPLRPAGLISKAVNLPLKFVTGAIDLPWQAALAAIANLAQRRSRLVLSTEWPAPEALDSLTQSLTLRRYAIGKRDRSFLEWRFRDSPRLVYDVVFVYKRNTLVGYLTTRQTEYRGYKCLFLIDSFLGISITDSDWNFICWHLTNTALALNTDMLLVLAHSNSPLLDSLTQFPLIKIPERILPQPTPVFVEWLSKAPPEWDATRMHLTLADCDMF
jgi:hypothetical protein